MATGRMDRNAFVGKLLAAQDGDVRREGMRVLAQALMDPTPRRPLWTAKRRDARARAGADGGRGRGTDRRRAPRAHA
jgi:hypothetical protein